MKYIYRSIATQLDAALKRRRSILLLGPRQTGKTTFLKRLPIDLFLSLAPASNRLRYEKDPSLLAKQIGGLKKGKRRLPLVVLDEVQKVPALMDEIQELIDNNIAQFILSGSSARKLRQTKTNWLAGRILLFHMDPLTVGELDATALQLESLLTYGSLPHIITTERNVDRERELRSYVTIYLDEEIRAEAAVRQLSSFARFLELAASESGNIVNFTKLAQEIGVAQTTIASYYQILQDCLIVERIEPLTYSKTRRKLTKSPKYLFFDLGVRRVAANEGINPPLSVKGNMFEQLIGLELIRLARLQEEPFDVHFWRDPGGPEVDFVVKTTHGLFPIEVKLTDTPTEGDIRHLGKFLDEYPESKIGYIICQTPHRLKLTKRIFALPWQDLAAALFSEH